MIITIIGIKINYECMNRRRFSLLAGSTVLSSATLGSSTRGSVGVEFNISQVPQSDPSNVDILVVELNKLDLIPQYLDDTESLTVSASVNLDGVDSRMRTADVGFDNGVKTTLDDIEDDEPNFRYFKFNPAGTDSNVLKGSIDITVRSSEIDESYTQVFYISGSGVFHDKFEDQSFSEWTVDYDLNPSISNSFNASNNGSYSLVPATNDFDRADSYSVLMYQNGFSVQPPFAEFSYITTDNSGGGIGMALYNENNNVILYMGSTNGEVGMNAGYGSEEITDTESYNTWNRIRAEFNWDNNNVTVHYDEMENSNISQSSASQSFANNSNSICRVELFATDGSNDRLGTASGVNIVSNAYYVDNCFAPLSDTQTQHQSTRFDS